MEKHTDFTEQEWALIRLALKDKRKDITVPRLANMYDTVLDKIREIPYRVPVTVTAHIDNNITDIDRFRSVKEMLNSGTN